LIGGKVRSPIISLVGSRLDEAVMAVSFFIGEVSGESDSGAPTQVFSGGVIFGVALGIEGFLVPC
jgi:hypothetical protein